MQEIRKIQLELPEIRSKKRVAAYARVSQESEALLHSLATQVRYFSTLIQNNPEWEFAGVFADEGITGTSTAHRNEFNRLLSECNAGKIDMVLVKSISRFARDTIDCLNTVRHLKNLGISVFFERESIDTMSEEGELMLTLLASFAQEESRSISENIKWATRKRFEQGIPNGHKPPFGYQWDGEMFRIIPKQAEVVREVYERFLAGESAYGIAKSLASQGVTGQKGLPIEQSAVKEILSSMSYTGTMVLQKYFFTEAHHRRKNKGELPMYLVDEMFEPIISVEEYEKAQEIRLVRAERFPNNRSSLTVFSGKMKCGYCGFGISRRTTSGKKRWVCNTRERKGMKICGCQPIWESDLEAAAATCLGGHFDQNRFAKEIQQVILLSDRVEFMAINGKNWSVLRQSNG